MQAVFSLLFPYARRLRALATCLSLVIASAGCGTDEPGARSGDALETDVAYGDTFDSDVGDAATATDGAAALADAAGAVATSVCQVCTSDSDCMPGDGVGGRCQLFGGGFFCLAACLSDADCGAEQVCQLLPGAEGDGKACAPKSGSCPCPDGQTGACRIDNEHGQCPGTFTCVNGKVGSCAASVPAAEICDGLDNDCDGQTDDAIPPSPCERKNSFGTCTGTSACVDGSVSCTGEVAKAEACNGKDDDCDGLTDEGFINTDGKAVGGDALADCVDPDDDGDGVLDVADNCTLTSNAQQADLDNDGTGDVCDADLDGDGALNAADNCELVANQDQLDTDKDGAGDACDPDDDGDGVIDLVDNCSQVVNAAQADQDKDGKGDACDEDLDGDGVVNAADNCTATANGAQLDVDNDGLGDACDTDIDGDGAANDQDNCPMRANKGQTDTDKDGKGDMCDFDDDDDGVLDVADNCTWTDNANQLDQDKDGKGDACDADLDGDGAVNDKDNCPNVANKSQANLDKDKFGDLCDDDDDGDGLVDGVDNCPAVVNSAQSDLDKDGKGDACDADLDGDGIVNGEDNCPAVANKAQSNLDKDKFGDLCDDDVDGDTIANDKDNCPGKHNPKQADKNNNGKGDVCETDWDSDGVANSKDNCPWIANPQQQNLDNDVDGDACDCDLDGDGVANTSAASVGCPAPVGVDNCPAVANKAQSDLDGDGAGDVCDGDIDGDADPNKTDCNPKNAAVSHHAKETCNGIDDDCDGQVDPLNALGCKLRFPDKDKDGWGESVAPACACTATGAWTAWQGGDCVDTDKAVYPGHSEACDGKDNNCNGLVDETVKTAWHIDKDGDGHGAGVAKLACTPPGAKWVADGTDCNDADKSVSPAAKERCNDIDDDCDGAVDQGLAVSPIYWDFDRDGWAAKDAETKSKCDVPAGWTRARDANLDGKPDWDCDDTTKSTNPAAQDVCGDGVDNDCDGGADRICFTTCGGQWPYVPSQTGLKPYYVHMVDLDGDGQLEVIYKTNASLSVLSSTGKVLLELSLGNANWSNVVFADMDTYDVYDYFAKSLDMFTCHASTLVAIRPQINKTTGKVQGFVVDKMDPKKVGCYDSADLLARDLNGDGSPEFVAKTHVYPSTGGVTHYELGIIGFDTKSQKLKHLYGIADPAGQSQSYNGGRMAYDLDGDGTIELMYGSGYMNFADGGPVPSRWSGRVYLFSLTNPKSWGYQPFCKPNGSCMFDMSIKGLTLGDVRSIRAHRHYLQMLAQYAVSPDGKDKVSKYVTWRFDRKGKPLPGFPPSDSDVLNLDEVDYDNDGQSEPGFLGRSNVWDVRGDGHLAMIDRNSSRAGLVVKYRKLDPKTGAPVQVPKWGRNYYDWQPVAVTNHDVLGGVATIYGRWDINGDGRMNVIFRHNDGTLDCRALGASTFNPYSSVPSRNPTVVQKTNHKDHYEPNEGQDVDKDGLPDRYAHLDRAMTRTKYGVHSYLADAKDNDVYEVHTSDSPVICLRSPPKHQYTLSVYSFGDKVDNKTKALGKDGKPDGLVWSKQTAKGAEVCYSASSEKASRYGEYRFLVKVATDGAATPYWPYWLRTP